MADAKISALTNYTSPQDADVLPIVDTANTSTKKITWANIKAALNSLYQATLVSGTNIKTINSNSILGSGDLSITATVSDGDKGDITVSSSGTVWNIDAATIGLTELSATGTPSASTFLRGDNTWATPSGSGDVSKVGTPVDNQIGVWTGNGTIEGDANLTFDTTTETLALAPSTGTSIFSQGGVNILVDSPRGTMTLSNIDALDATTEATIEAAIDTLANLTSIQGNTITVSGTSTINQNVSTTGNPQFATIELGNATDTTISRTGAGAIAVEGVGVALNSTSLAHTASQYEVGNASDTTITRSSAGVIAVEGVVIPSISSTNTLTNKRVTPRVGTTTSSATPTINTDNVDYYSLTAQTVDITSFTTNLSGTPTDGQRLWISITGTAARAITWGSSFEASTIALPTTTVTTNRLDVGFIWNAATSKWRCVGTA